MNKSLFPYEIYTDGSAKGNDPAKRLGGWAYCILFDNTMVRKDSGCVTETTNQRMELQAVIEAIKGIEILTNASTEYNYIVYSDSAYVVNCYEKGWYVGWESNGWKNARKDPVKNMDLWSQIIPYFKRKSWTFCKVPGHADNYYNNYVDKLAQDAANPKNIKG